METATIFSVGFHNKIPTGALLLVSDSPMVPEGVKTEESDKSVTHNFVDNRKAFEILARPIHFATAFNHKKPPGNFFKQGYKAYGC